jgi:hypothetical protein
MKNNEIFHIDRIKKKTLAEKIKEKFNNIDIYFIKKTYKKEKLLFRVLYDKIYRNDIYTMILNSSKEPDQENLENKNHNSKSQTRAPNINLARNIFKMNEENILYFSIKPNSEKSFNDDSLYPENRYIQNLQKFNKWHNILINLMVPFGIITAYFKLRKKENYFKMMAISSFFLLVGDIYSIQQNSRIGKNGMEDFHKENNKEALEAYRRFYYDN